MVKKVLIEVPYWLGDCIMTTPALENLAKLYPDSEWTIFGSQVSTDLCKNHPRVKKIIVDTTRGRVDRWVKLWTLLRQERKYEYTLSFRRSSSAKVFLFFASSKAKFSYRRTLKSSNHQVVHYNQFINEVFAQDTEPGPLKIYYKPQDFSRPTLGINPGATYGSAKRWYPERFAQVAAQFSHDYQVAIFGGPNEKEIAKDICMNLEKLGVKNYLNYAGKTSIASLCSLIGGLDLFITADSGPMHIAAAYGIPTVSLFGPTRHEETCSWQNPRSLILRKEVECAPCMKRKCPLGHHKCMDQIQVGEAVNALSNLKVILS